MAFSINKSFSFNLALEPGTETDKQEILQFLVLAAITENVFISTSHDNGFILYAKQNICTKHLYCLYHYLITTLRYTLSLYKSNIQIKVMYNSSATKIKTVKSTVPPIQ